MTKRMLRVPGQVIGGMRGIDCPVALLLCVWCSIDALAGSVAENVDEPAAQRAADLAPPVLVMAGGKPIDVDGYAAPFVGDFDGDGRRTFSSASTSTESCTIYRNVGTNAEPKSDGFEWFTVGGLPACVPAGCYVGFTPLRARRVRRRGRTDILTGSLPGVHFLFRRNSNGSFAQAEVLRDKHAARVSRRGACDESDDSYCGMCSPLDRCRLRNVAGVLPS